MIGIYGIFNFDKSAPADASIFSKRIPKQFVAEDSPAAGCSIGHATHRGTCLSYKYLPARGQHVYVAGWIANTEYFTVPNTAHPTPAEVVLQMVENDAHDQLATLNGQFCAAIYNEHTHELKLLTDRNGTFPLYVWQDTHGVAFASQLHVLNALDRIPKRVNRAALSELFTIQRTLGDKTPVAGIKALAAANLTTVREGKVTSATYWQMEWKNTGISKHDCSEKLAVALRNAVTRQTKITDNSGLLLSGGLDSRMIVSVAPEGSVSCWTTASYEQNPELELSKQVAVNLSWVIV